MMPPPFKPHVLLHPNDLADHEAQASEAMKLFVQVVNAHYGLHAEWHGYWDDNLLGVVSTNGAGTLRVQLWIVSEGQFVAMVNPSNSDVVLSWRLPYLGTDGYWYKFVVTEKTGTIERFALARIFSEEFSLWPLPPR